MKVESLALIGLGSIGRRHLRILRKIYPALKIILVRSGKGKDWPELELVDRVVYSLQDVIDAGVQAAIIASPATLHVQQAISLAQAGIHLLIEKPLSHKLQGVDNLLETVTKNDVVGLVGYVLRYDPASNAFKEKLGAGQFGQLLHVRVEASSYLPDWRPEQDYRQSTSSSVELGGGVLLELSHELDYIRWFFGEMNSVVARLHNSHYLQVDVEDCVDMILEDSQGVPISLHLDFHQRNPVRRCVVAGSEGTAVWDLIEDQIIWHPAYGEKEVEQFNSKRDDLFQNQLQHFFSCVEEGDQPRVTLKDGLQALKLVEAARLANETGQRQVLL